MVIREDECDGDSLYEAAKQLLSDRERCRAMRSAAANLAVVDAAERIYQTALELCQTLTRGPEPPHRMGKPSGLWREEHGIFSDQGCGAAPG